MHQMRLLSASLVLAFGLSACGGSDSTSAAEASGQTLAGTGCQAQRIIRADPDELAQHASLLADIQQDSKGKCLWLRAELID